jgi:UDP-N-acetylmuramoyl-tripeptide--D-alanyl-D-alanine ligase
MVNRDSDRRLHFKRQVFSKTMETTLCRLKQYFEKSIASQREDVQPSEHLLRCGTALAKSSDYLKDDRELPVQLSRLYRLSINGEPDEGKEEAPLSYRIQRLRFLIAYQKGNISTAGEIGRALQIFRKSRSVNGDDTPIYSAEHLSGMPQSMVYEYVRLLAEMWRGLGDAGAHESLKEYVEDILKRQTYHQICKNHSLPGLLALLFPQYTGIARDIILQHFFRNSYMRSVLKKDPWRLWEQVGLFLSACPDPTIFHYSSALLVKHIENFSHAIRFSAFETVVLESIQLVNILRHYLGYLQQHSIPDTGLSDYEFHTESVMAAVEGEILAGTHESQRFTMATYMSSRMQPETLYISPDENWTKKYRTRSLAYPAGAAAVLTSCPPGEFHGDQLLDQQPDQQLIGCRNTFSAMLKPAIANRDHYKGKVVGITGSVGKTSTAAMLHDVLASTGRPYKNISMFNHETGVPISVLNIPQKSDYAVIEMGMGRPLSILPKTILARPHVVIVTEIQYDHMEFHDSIDSVITTKMEIVEGLEPGGVVILNRDSLYFPRMLGIAQAKGVAGVITFGEHPLADIRAKSITLFPGFSEIQADIAGKLHTYRLALPGKHMALNSLAVCAAVYALGADTAQMADMFQIMQPQTGRNEIFEAVLENGAKIQVINDSFNANPASMRSSFHILSLVEPHGEGRRLMVLGDMGELGIKSREYHEGLADDINRSKIDVVFSVGSLTPYLDRKISSTLHHRHFSSIEALRRTLFNTLRDGDVVSFKGSARNNDLNALITYLRGLMPEPITTV